MMGRTAISVMLADVNEANPHILDPASERRVRSETGAEPLIHRPFGKPAYLIGSCAAAIVAEQPPTSRSEGIFGSMVPPRNQAPRCHRRAARSWPEAVMAGCGRGPILADHCVCSGSQGMADYRTDIQGRLTCGRTEPGRRDTTPV